MTIAFDPAVMANADDSATCSDCGANPIAATLVEGRWVCPECEPAAEASLQASNRRFVSTKTGRRYPGTHAVVYAPPAQSREEFLTVRRDGIGGSDVAAIAGLSPYQGAYEVWLQKTNQAPLSEMESGAIRWGNLLEEPIAKEFSRETGKGIVRNIGTLQHPERPYMLVNLDAVATEAPGKRKAIGVVEVKTGGLFGQLSWDSPNELPDHYMLQVQHELEVSGLDRAWVPAFLGYKGFVIIEVERNDNIIASMLDIEEAFWERVESRTPPPLDGLTSTTKLVNRLHNVEPGKVIEIEPHVLTLIEQREAAKAEAKAIQEHAAALENQIKTLMGDAEVATIGGSPVCTWKESERKGYEVAPSTVRTFRTMSIKGKAAAK